MAEEIRTALGSLEWRGRAILWKDDRSVDPGDEWEKLLYNNLKSSDIVLACVSRHYLASRWCRREVELATRAGVLLLPCLLEPWDIEATPLGHRQAAVRGSALSEAWDDQTRSASWLRDLVRDVDRALDRSERFRLNRQPAKPIPSAPQWNTTMPTPAPRRRGLGASSMGLGIGVVALGVTAGIAAIFAGVVLRTDATVSPTVLPSLEMVEIEGHPAFTLGADASGEVERDERPRIAVPIRSFWVSKTEVTQAQYTTIMDDAPWKEQDGLGDDVAAHNISWLRAIRFVNQLSAREGLDPCYRETPDRVTWPQGLDCEGYRLLTEAEWEFAARGGEIAPRERFGWGDDPRRARRFARYRANSGDKVGRVGQKKPNRCGLYDMHGNVREWVWDGYDRDAYEKIRSGERELVDRSTVLKAQTPKRVLRGGSIDDDANALRSSKREFQSFIYEDRQNGFRVARTVARPADD